MTDTRRVVLMDGATMPTTIIARGELPTSLIDTKLPIRFRNRLFAYVRHSFDGVVIYQVMPEPINVDDIFDELL